MSAPYAGPPIAIRSTHSDFRAEQRADIHTCTPSKTGSCPIPAGETQRSENSSDGAISLTHAKRLRWLKESAQRLSDEAKYDVLVLRSVHVVAKLVGGQPELGFEADVCGGRRGIRSASHGSGRIYRALGIRATPNSEIYEFSRNQYLSSPAPSFFQVAA
jgi:hypothetical protein